jgi:hypothetical protein
MAPACSLSTELIHPARTRVWLRYVAGGLGNGHQWVAASSKQSVWDSMTPKVPSGRLNGTATAKRSPVQTRTSSSGSLDWNEIQEDEESIVLTMARLDQTTHRFQENKVRLPRWSDELFPGKAPCGRELEKLR